MSDQKTRPDNQSATLSHLYTPNNGRQQVPLTLNPGDYGTMPHYQKQIRHYLDWAIEEERRVLDWTIPNRTTDQALADRWEYLRHRRASLESQSHIGHQRRQTAFHLICMCALLFILLQVTNARIHYPLIAHGLPWLMMGLSLSALAQVVRGFLSGYSHLRDCAWLAQSLDSRMGDAPEVRIPTRSGWEWRFLRPVIGGTTCAFRLPFLKRSTRLLPMREVNVRLSAIEHLQVREAVRVSSPYEYRRDY